MDNPGNLIPLIDADVLRYEVGYAAEVGWQGMVNDPESLPPWEYVKEALHNKLRGICVDVSTDQEPILYMTKGRTFRYDIAKRKPYKGQRIEKKPWHFKNLSVYMADVLGANVIEGIEADDAIAIHHCANMGTIVCTRDKDLRQLPGWFYSWELGNQPSFGPDYIDHNGSLLYDIDKRKLKGTGLAFFYAQVIMGDTTDNIPGLPRYGDAAAFKMLNSLSPNEQLEAVCGAYKEVYDATWEEELTEQGQLCWLVRRMNEDGSPQLWEIGLDR